MADYDLKEPAEARLALGLGNVDNTTDAGKPVSTAQAAAIANEAALRSGAVNAEALAREVADNKLRTDMNAGFAVAVTSDSYGGQWDASVSTFPTVRSVGAGPVLNGVYFEVSIAGTIDGQAFGVGDTFRALIDNPSATVLSENWSYLGQSAIIAPLKADIDQLLKLVANAEASQTNVDAAALVLANGRKFTMNGWKYKLDSTATTADGWPFDGAIPWGKWFVEHWGAVGDGAVDIEESFAYLPTGTGAVSGTDNYAAIKQAVKRASASRRMLCVQELTYRVQIPDVDAQVIFPSNGHFHLKGNGEIIGDDNRFYNGAGGAGQLGNVLFGTDTAKTGSLDNDTHDFFKIEGVTLRGTWWREMEGLKDRTWTANDGYRLHMIGGSNCKQVELIGVTFKDVIGMASISEHGQQFTAHNCNLNRVGGDGIRGIDFSSQIVTNNRILHCDDDSIALAADDVVPNAARPRRRTAIVTNNIIECSEGPIFLGALDLTFSNNKMSMTYGTGLTVFAQKSDDASKGEGGVAAISMVGNTVLNHMSASTRTTTPSGGWGSAIPAVLIGGNGSPLIGFETTTPTKSPWDATELTWGALHAQDVAQPTAVSGYAAYGLTCSDMVVMRTLPTAANYSDYGYGKRFTRWGFDDPAVADANFAEDGIKVGGYWDGLSIVNPRIMGMIGGAGVRFSTTADDMSLRNVVVDGGDIIDCNNGVDGSAAGGSHEQDVLVQNVRFNLDPHRRSTSRNSNGWSVTTFAAPTCIKFNYVTGVSMLNNRFQNASNPWSVEGGVTDANGGNGRVHGNVGVVDFGEAGTSSTHSGNLGLGRIHTASEAISYEVRDLVPTSATFGTPRDGMKCTNAALSGSGYYVRGHIQRLTNGQAYYRLLTGTGAVVNTDWAEI